MKYYLSHFLIAAVIYFNSNLFPQNRSLRFKNIDIEQGLSNNMIKDILQDSRGFMWIATWDGLNRYDGYSFKVYKNKDGNTTSLRMNKISCLLEDSHGRLWVGTFGGGLSLFNRDKESFTNFVNNPNDSFSIASDHILSLYEDSKKRIWVGTRSAGLSLIENSKSIESNSKIRFTNLQLNSKNLESLVSRSVMCITEDKSGTLWIGTNYGTLIKLASDKGGYKFINFSRDQKSSPNNLFDCITEDYYHEGLLWLQDYYNGVVWFDTKNEKFVYNYPYSKILDNISLTNIISTLVGSDGQYWFGTDLSGIYVYSPKVKNAIEESFERYLLNPLEPEGRIAPNVTKLYEDRSGLIWVGTNTNGIYIHNINTRSFYNFYNHPFNKNSLISDNVFSVLEDRDGNVWIGTHAGLDKYDKQKKLYTHFKSDGGNSGTSSNIIYSLLQDSSGAIWIGTSAGLDRYNHNTNSFSHFYHNPQDSNSISNGEVIKLFKDSKGSFWIGTWNGGLNKLVFNSREKSVKFLHYKLDKADPQSISDNRIMSIAESKEGELWIGTADGGINKLLSDYFVLNDGSVVRPKFISYRNDPQNPNSLSNNDVRTILIDKSGTIWIGTYGGGLNKFIPPGNPDEKIKFIHYRQTDGLANDVVRGVLQDNNGYLWISTSNGLSKFDPQSNKFLNFSTSDGLQTVKFEDVYFKSQRSGLIYFGGIGGVVAFNPSEVKINHHKPQIVITSLRKYNIETGQIAEEIGISEKKEITLSYDENILSFEFSALDYYNSIENSYRYKLEGYNDAWIELGNKREVTLTNLNPGEYIMRVSGSNNNGVWNEAGTSLKLIITPPWWRTNFAFVLYGLVLIAGIFVVDRLMRRRVIRRERYRADLREAQLVRKQAAELEVVDRLVKVINQAEDLDNLFNSLLRQTMKFIPQAEKAAVFLFNSNENLFRVAFTAGYAVKDLEKISFTYEELKKRYSLNADEFEKGIYILKDTSNLYGNDKLKELISPKSMLVMEVEKENVTQAFVVFDNFSEDNPFDSSAAGLLNRFREHAVSAITKAQAIRELQEKNEEILRTQEQLVTQQKLASLGALTAGIAHEIKNPLNFVNNFSEVSKELLEELIFELNNEDKQEAKNLIDDLKQNLDKINSHGKRADSIVKGMLLHSRGTSGEKVLTNINELFEQYVNLAYHGMRAQNKEFNVTIEKYYDETIEKINVIPQDLSRVFLNFINNAFYTLNEKKKNYKGNFKPVLKVFTKNLIDKIEIRIWDNGSGIPAEIKNKVFTPFFTTKPAGEGTGLGLSISYDIIVKQHSGDIKFESEAGEFTEFTIVLPKK